MSGHSKWHNIKLRKSKVDSQKGKMFTKVAREIIIAAREGGGDPAGNFRLRVVIEKARGVNMPQENIKRAIQKGTGDAKDGSTFEEILYEGYGPAGVALLISVVTDNRNRTAADVRNILSRNGGSLGESGCVLWMFDKKGIFTFSSGKVKEDDIFMVATDAGADDVNSEDENIEVTCSPQDFQALRETLEKNGFVPEDSKISMLPKTTVSLDEDGAKKVLKLIDLLEDYDDVQEVYSNFDISDEIMEKLD
ncbi:MAG: YebC/PmpR family DNA-binding transcriptional regulator [Candidatus Eremiobacterota bacterium]